MTTESRRLIRVELGARSYDVVVGADLFAEAATRIAARQPRVTRVAIVSDDVVAPLYLARLAAALPEPAVPVVIPAGEPHKRMATLERMCEAFAAGGLDRRSLVLALGGGVVGDLAGFAAAVYMRGIAFAQLPTTLLAQVDASVGGKTAVDLDAGKNLVGAFHQPSFVLADVTTLASLPARERAAGLAEVVKTGLIGDATLFELCETRAGDLTGAGAAAPSPAAQPLWTELVARAVAVKAGVVSRDEREDGERAYLNLGHTVGHAIEAAAGYGPILHGEAVGLGLIAACRVGARLGITGPALEARVTAVLAALGLPTDLEPWLTPEVLARTGADKKRTGATLRYVVPAATPGGSPLVGCRTVDLTPAQLAENLRK
ncbi:MAG: 3-dehydroquinate synthase [Deltaproteobacteria bacterium]|nr:3-dehydroquinate synthase [Deltaproteobacteria bacterium]